ncbi:TPA: RecT family recombinase [Yersinia enterocolitica]|uniref:RecT family recombinase n=1 Tax=Yersinia intermedia TaxID=631 RepID=UPI0005DB6A00|nr:RecT family recombinase [Yersinia intermedia]CNI85890.1 RecT family [Yersinia intermedia]
MTDIANLDLSQETEVTNSNVAVFSARNLQAIQKFAEVMASGKSTVPKHLSGSTADCMAVTMQAVQWGMNPFAVAQKTHLVNGTLGYEAQLVNAVIVSSGAIVGRFKYKYGGDWGQLTGETKSEKRNEAGLFIQVGALIKGEQEVTWGEPVYLQDVTTRNSPLWKTQPKQQLAYLSVKYWARLYCPEVILGVYSTDELDGKPKPERDVTPRTNADLNKMINTKKAEPIEGELETTKVDERSPDVLLADFTSAASNAKSVEELDKFFKYTKRVLAVHHDQLEKATDIYGIRKAEMEEVPM